MRKSLLVALILVVVPSVPSVMAAPPPTAATRTPAKKIAFEPITGRAALSSVRTTGTLRVCMALNAPWVMHDKDGNLVGYSVDVARQFADDMKWKLQSVPGSWDTLLLNLRTNQCDIAISGISITPQRALEVRFSDPYGQYDVGIVVNRKAFAKGGIADFEAAAAGKKVAALAGTVDVDIAQHALPGAQIVKVDGEGQALAGLRDGSFEAYVAEAPRPMLLAGIHPEDLRELSGQPLGRTAHGMAVRVGSDRLLDVANAWIISVQANGWLATREDYWFKTTAWGDRL